VLSFQLETELETQVSLQGWWCASMSPSTAQQRGWQTWPPCRETCCISPWVSIQEP